MRSPSSTHAGAATWPLLALVLLFGCGDAGSRLQLSRLVADGMVLQRDVEVPIRGRAAPGAEVTVTLDGDTVTASAGDSGDWTAILPPRPAGGPFELTVAAGGERMVVRDVMAGDVWLCSGQSNMEWTVIDARDGEAEVAAANDPAIRHFQVPKGWSGEPQTALSGGAWEAADPDHAGGFTAVGYFFARELRLHVDVPIGLIHASWGGSRIESWMSGELLGVDGGQILAIEAEQNRRALEAVRERIGELPERDAGLVDGNARWADPALDDATWDEMELPVRWEQAGLEGMDGIVWFRRSFELSEDAAREGAELGLGFIDDGDNSWINGYHAGRMERAWNQARVYPVPAGVLLPGRNVVTVRVEDTGGGGGIYGPPDSLYLEAGGERLSLAGTWKFKVGAATVNAEGRKNQIPTLLYNQMIHPLRSFPVRGFLWYQGESNAGAADAFVYRDHFARLIEGWRADWGQGEAPFLFVQLANFLPAGAEPADSSWALLRESQSAALALPDTAQAVTIDVGDPHDVHPRNKQDVGRRLALAARKLAYGQDVVYSGPVYRGHQVSGGRVIVEFDHVGGGLGARGPEGEVSGFRLAGEDRRFVDAEAVIDGDRVVVSSDQVPAPVAVRYAWADNPEAANLANAEGLPASPFRTDDWELGSN